MEITHFCWNRHSVSWIYKDVKREYVAENIIYASVDEQQNLIYLVCGMEFIENRFLYLSFEGEEWVVFDKISDSVTWGPNHQKVTIQLNNIIDVKPSYMEEKLIIILYHEVDGRNKMAAYQINGENRFISEIPSTYKSLYLSSVNQVPTVVCEIPATDLFERSLWHFKIDRMTGKLTKSNLAY